MKVGIIVPYSWSFWGGVPEHAHHQARALNALGIETRTIIGYDPPDLVTRFMHPRTGRPDAPPPDVLSAGRSVIVPANGALVNIVLSPAAFFRVRRYLEEERFDVIHVHEPLTPATGVAAMSLARCPIVATFHASGDLGWMKFANPVWGFLADRIDHRIVVSETARETVQRFLPGDYDVIPNGVAIPEETAVEREHRVVFLGRHDPRKGLQVLLRAWPEIRRETGARLRILGADPLQVQLLLTRLRVSSDGVDALGVVGQEERSEELLSAKALVAPSLHGESFGMVLTEAFACATPVVASDISGYRDLVSPATGLLVPPDDPRALGEAVCLLLADEARRRELGFAGRRVVRERYSWEDIARTLADVYDLVSGQAPVAAAAAR